MVCRFQPFSRLNRANKIADALPPLSQGHKPPELGREAAGLGAAGTVLQKGIDVLKRANEVTGFTGPGGSELIPGQLPGQTVPPARVQAQPQATPRTMTPKGGRPLSPKQKAQADADAALYAR